MGTYTEMKELKRKKSLEKEKRGKVNKAKVEQGQ
jgi:hypothetical protein